MKTLCFDKTGTLTQNKMEINGIFHLKNEKELVNLTGKLKNNELISGLFACCNSV